MPTEASESFFNETAYNIIATKNGFVMNLGISYFGFHHVEDFTFVSGIAKLLRMIILYLSDLCSESPNLSSFAIQAVSSTMHYWSKPSNSKSIWIITIIFIFVLISKEFFFRNMYCWFTQSTFLMNNSLLYVFLSQLALYIIISTMVGWRWLVIILYLVHWHWSYTII